MISPELAAQFPFIVLLIIIFGMVFGGIAIAVKWIWARYKEIREADVAWRSEQNKLRDEAEAKREASHDAAVEKRDAEMRDFFTLLNKGTALEILTMRQTAAHMIEILDKLVAAQSMHDTRSQKVRVAITEIQTAIEKLVLICNGKVAGN